MAITLPTSRGVVAVTEDGFGVALPLAMSKPPRHVSTTVSACGICVLPRHGLLVIAALCPHTLEVYSLINGSFVRSMCGDMSTTHKHFVGFCDLCVTPDGDGVLVADPDNNRVQELGVVDPCPRTRRSIGGSVLHKPCSVHCNAHIIAVAELWVHRVSVLSWRDGDLLYRFGTCGAGNGQLRNPNGLHVLAGSSGLVVADTSNNRLCVFKLSGEFVAAVDGLVAPSRILSSSSTEVIVRSSLGRVWRVTRDGRIGRFNINISARALATLPDGGFVIQRGHLHQLSVFYGLDLRVAWMQLCASHGEFVGSRFVLFRANQHNTLE